MKVNKLTAVILEDDQVSRMILEHFCSNHPEVKLLSSFEDVAEAAAFLQETPADIIFLDINLKSSNGFSLIDQVPSSCHFIVTAGDPANIEKAKTLGLKHSLLKPISLDAFMWGIEHIKKEMGI